MRIRRKVIITGALAFTALVLFALTDTSRFKDFFIFKEKRGAENEPAVVTKIIDGDTLVAAGGNHVRLIGIDADEKGYPCFDVARRRLEELVLPRR